MQAYLQSQKCKTENVVFWHEKLIAVAANSKSPEYQTPPSLALLRVASLLVAENKETKKPQQHTHLPLIFSSV